MLQTKLGVIQLENPFILASGVLGVNAALMLRIANAGAGAITTKSIGLEPREGYNNPTVVELGGGNILNAMGLPNPGSKDFVEEIKEFKKQSVKPIFASIFGKDCQEFCEVARIINKAQPSAFELNISCPHGGKYGAIIGQDSALVEEITREVKQITKKPVFVKISPNLTDLSVPAEAALAGGADGIVVINTLRAMAIDITYRMPILANKFGGLSGPCIKPVALKCVFDLYAKFGKKVPIIGVGGISSWQDVIEFFLAGASAVQIGTALAYYGNVEQINLFSDFAEKIKTYLKQEGFTSITELIGLAHENSEM